MQNYVIQNIWRSEVFTEVCIVEPRKGSGAVEKEVILLSGIIVDAVIPHFRYCTVHGYETGSLVDQFHALILSSVEEALPPLFDFRRILATQAGRFLLVCNFSTFIAVSQK